MIKIFLIGFMGSGKTYVGQRLADGMKLPFYDLDECIERKEKRSISQIFQQEGEAYFRRIESKYLKDFAQVQDAVIACGGGTPCFFDNMDWMNAHGITIYLQTPSSILLDRLKKETALRPLLANKSMQELSDYITEKLKERNVFYEKAAIIYHCQQEDEDIVGNILRHLSYTDWKMETGED